MAEGSLKYQVYTKCFVCNSSDLSEAFDFGIIPLADYLVEEGAVYQVPAYPLHLNYCNHCGFLFLKEGVHQEVLFNEHYPYFTSVNPSLVRHFSETFNVINKRKKVDASSTAIEAASNDGYLLEHFLKLGARALGIEPSAGPARAAESKGIATRVNFFSKQLAVQLAAEGWEADFFMGNNVLAHVKNPNDFIRGVQLLLKPDGLGIFEFPYKKRMFEKVEFDTIFHQHLCYFSLSDIIRLFENNGLCVLDVEEIDVHGGSLRVFVGTHGRLSKNAERLLKRESEDGLNGKEKLNAFLNQVKIIKNDLNTFLDKAKTEKKRVFGYGAAGKANTLLSYCEVTSAKLPFIIDISPHKQGKYFSTGKIPIRDIGFLKVNSPDYILILAWNFTVDIISHLKTIMPASTKYVIPIPSLTVL